MATYKTGTVTINAAGLMTGVGTNWTAANALVRTGATVMLMTSPVRVYTVGAIKSATSIQLTDFGSDSAISSATKYAILLHDGLTVQALAQNVAETLRYYQNFEDTLGTAATLNVGENSGNVMKVGAFGLGSKALALKTPSNGNDLMKILMERGCGWWRSPAVSTSGATVDVFPHGASFFSYAADTMSAINVDYASAKVKIFAANEASITAGSNPKMATLYSTVSKPEINNDTTGTLSVANGGTGSSTQSGALKNLGVIDYIPVKNLPTTSTDATWVEVGSIVDSGQGGGWVSFIIGGCSGYGSGRMNSMIVTVSARGIITAWNNDNLRTNITIKEFMGNSQTSPTSAIVMGMTKVNTNTFKLYAKLGTYTAGFRLTVLGGMSMGGSGTSIQGWISGATKPADITTEPAGIKYVTTDQVIDEWMAPKKDIAFQSVKINPDSGGEARIFFNTDDYSASKGGQIRSTNNNGNVVISSGTNGSGVFGNIFLRTGGTSSNNNQFIFDNSGNATSQSGQWKNASDIRLKRKFKAIESPLEAVMSFRGATYEMKASGVRAVGVIAQDIAKECPDAIGRMEVEIDGETISDAMSVDTAGFAAAYSVEAMKEVIKLMDLMLEDPEAAKERIKVLKNLINSELPE